MGEWDPVISRRRQVFVGLLAAAGATLLLGLMFGLGILLLVHVAIDVILAGFVVFLIRTKNREIGEDWAFRAETNPEEEEWLRAGEL